MSSDGEHSTLWSWQALVEACAGVPAGSPAAADLAISGVVADSRLVGSGDLFIALPGDPGPRFHPSARSSVDGHDFVAAAAARGASVALVHRVPEGGAAEGAAQPPLIVVEDTYDGLWALGAAARARLSGDVVAVTGSSGKTTAKHFLGQALDAYIPPGSFNNHIGVPLALANAPAASVTSVFEIGTSFPGEIEPLAQMVEPNLALVLNVGVAHLENFPSRKGLEEEKLSIFSSLSNKSNAIYRYGLPVEQGASFGTEAGADARLVALDGDLATLSVFGESMQGRVPMGGQHRAETMLACVLAAKLLGRDLLGSLNLTPEAIPAGRGTVHQAGDIAVTDDAYNANPDSMGATVTAFLARPIARDASAATTVSGRRVLVLGEMLELGDLAAHAHEGIAVQAAQADLAVLVGAGFEAAARATGLMWFAAADEGLVAWLREQLGTGDQVLVKGSNRVFWARGFVAELLAALAQS